VSFQELGPWVTGVTLGKRSAGIVLYRRTPRGLEVLLVHPGGPFWARKDEGAWSIPKGEFEDGDDPLAAARREFEEEVGMPAEGEFLPLSPIRQRGGKVVEAWGLEGDFDPANLESNTFTMEWPPRSGRQETFPEVDRADWFTIDKMRIKLNSAQVALVEELLGLLGVP